MTIAINSTHFIKSAGNDLFHNYFLRIAAANREHQFIFITPAATNTPLATFQNTTHVISFPRANNNLMWKLWLVYTLPAIARKHKADIIINTGPACSLRTSLPQYLFISDLSFLHFPQFLPKRQLHFLKKNMPAFLHKATTIVTTADLFKKEIIQQYSIGEEKINSFQLTAGDQYQPIGWNEKEAIREKYTEGKEYFLFSGEIHARNNLVNLLKAFSFFKKRQKSNMQLIITSGMVSLNDPFIENLKTYKYRQEVSILMDLGEEALAKITAAAYAFIYPVMYESTGIFPLQAMQCEVPVITSNTGAISETTGDAALYVDPANFEDIADKMMLIFKDENKRREQINKGNLIVQKINADKMNDLLWKSILKTTT